MRATRATRKEERRRILLCKQGPADAIDQALLVAGGHARIETVGTLAEAITVCMKEEVDYLIVNMFSFTSSELTALVLFREIRPAQRVRIFCPEEAVSMLMSADLADECHAIAREKGSKERPSRARA